ncbi:ATP-binding mismatch repair protein, partial [Coemansia asiatica]
MMQAIDKDTVHRLCSGQVIIDLSTAVKELLENCLDADATVVDIKLRDSGMASISVSDNGHGIKERDFETLCRKHWTSKISSFEDLEGVSTFGFRGEALSSLCAVSKVIVTTATEETAPVGMQLEYDHNGEFVRKTPVAREKGTTVTLTDLFAKWPVRMQDLKKNIRREYLRLVGLVEQYAIISDKARITMTNQTKSGSTISVQTPPQADRLGRLVAVLGAQVRPHMATLDHRPTESSSGLDLLIEGNISKPIPEAGRSGSDKQYFFVNGRPCDFPRAKKLVNELFRSHCPTKYPVFAIGISINASTIDVNLTPDKRTILIRHEAELLEALKAGLASVLEPQES